MISEMFCSFNLSSLLHHVTKSTANSFTAFLSPEMAYSCPIYSSADETLESAQERKMRLMGLLCILLYSTHTFITFRYHITKAQIKPGHRVLEIGTGWGALSILLVKMHPDCTVDSLTLSHHQKALAEERIAAAGLSHKITVHLLDYRGILDNASWHQAFDRMISVEMMEAVGKQYLGTFWNVVDWALKKDDAVGVVQVITIPEARVANYDREVDFIQKWVGSDLRRFFSR